MIIAELKKDQLFRTEANKDFYTFNSCVMLYGSNIPAAHQNKLLVIYDGCKQMICDPKLKVLTVDDLIKKPNCDQ